MFDKFERKIAKRLRDAGGTILAPSILSADFMRLGEEIISAKNAGANMIHLDIMDGHFVPNITFGTPVVESIARSCPLPMDAHLMICDPIRYGKVFASLRVEIIIAHIEVMDDFEKFSRRMLKSFNSAIGVAISPQTKIQSPEKLLECYHVVLVMSVVPGCSGQKFMPVAVPKIEKLANAMAKMNITRLIGVDGGINPATSRIARDAGANFIVAGNGFFKAKNYKTAAMKLLGKK